MQTHHPGQTEESALGFEILHVALLAALMSQYAGSFENKEILKTLGRNLTQHHLPISLFGGLAPIYFSQTVHIL